MIIDDAAMQAAVSKAVLDALTPEARAELIRNAVADVLAKAPETRYGGEKRSRLQIAFDQAVMHQAEVHARTFLVEDEAFQANLKTLFAEVAERLFSETYRETIVSGFAQVITRALDR